MLLREHFQMFCVEERASLDDRGVILALPDSTGEAYLEVYDSEVPADFSHLSLQFRVADLDAFCRAVAC